MPTIFSSGAQLRIVGEIHGTETVNVLHFGNVIEEFDSETIAAQLLALANAMLACVVDALLPALTSDWRVKYVDAKLVYPNPTDPQIALAPAESVGEGGPASTSFIASLISVRTGGGGRRGRGRMYLPPVGEPQITASSIDPGTVALLAVFAACVAGKFIGAAATENWRFGVLSRTNLAGNPAAFNASFREATTLTPDSVAASLRSRKKGVGS